MPFGSKSTGASWAEKDVNSFNCRQSLADLSVSRVLFLHGVAAPVKVSSFGDQPWTAVTAASSPSGPVRDLWRGNAPRATR
jgi:hypothetical protein